MVKTLVLGLGNPILSDDGVGIEIVNRLKSLVRDDDVVIEEASIGGIRLVDMMAGYDRAIVVDAIKTRGGVPGQVYRLEVEDLAGTLHASSPHDLNFYTALELGRTMGMQMPGEVAVFAVEVDNIDTFHEGCCPEVERAIPEVMDAVLQELQS
ncbi:MAG: hydrogenase maturation protease [Chloroflexi bacterium]|nr:hydrogenase maturation protease [Chloroflexota bacterium]